MQESRSTPIACTLSLTDQKERHEHLQKGLFSRVAETTELPDGRAYQFPGDEETARELVEFINFERHCCAFSTFELHFAPEHGPITLSLHGPEGIREFLESYDRNDG